MQRITMGLLASSFLLIAPSVRSSALLSQNLELESRRVNGYWREMSGTPQNQKSDDMDFLSQFRRLPPGERMTVWKESNNRKYEKTIAFRVADKIQDTLIAEGTDVVPYLSKVIRNEQERYLYRYLALRILADMDRYVAERDFPPGVKATVVVSELRIRGAINPFLEINGRRIGSQGADALRWAANDKGDKHLQFYAKYETGLVEQELSALSLDVQVRRWEENACKNRIGGQPEDAVASTLLKLLVERMPESLDAVVERVTNGESSCVRRRAIEALRLTDLFRMRLRASETGRAAIEAVHRALTSGSVDPECARCEKPESAWKKLSVQFQKDDFGVDPGSQGAYYAQMLHALYGEDTVRIVHVGDISQEWAKPDFTDFVTFLTDQDSFFPSKEYTFFGRYAQGFHPQFQTKMARIEEAWKQFSASRHNSVSLLVGPAVSARMGGSAGGSFSLSIPICK